jgi:hypothetical protein
MDYEYLLRCLYYLLKIIATAPEACSALSKGRNAFAEFLRSLENPEVQEESPPPAPICISVFDTISLSGTCRTSPRLLGATLSFRNANHSGYYSDGGQYWSPTP